MSQCPGSPAILADGLAPFVSEDSSATTSTSSGLVRGRARVLQARQRRRRRAITSLPANRDVVTNMTYLEQVTVTPKTARWYRKELKDSLQWASHTPQGLLGDDSAVDAALVPYMAELFLRGEQPERGDIPMVAVLWEALFPEGRAARFKTYAVNGSVCPTTSIYPCLPQVMSKLMRSRRDDGLLFPFPGADYLAMLD